MCVCVSVSVSACVCVVIVVVCMHSTRSMILLIYILYYRFVLDFYIFVLVPQRL